MGAFFAYSFGAFATAGRTDSAREKCTRRGGVRRSTCPCQGRAVLPVLVISGCTPTARARLAGLSLATLRSGRDRGCGLLLPRELDERLGLSALIERHLTDPRTGRNRQFPLADLFRQSVYSRLAGYEDTNDAERLAADPTVRMLVSRERRETGVALTHPLVVFSQDGDGLPSRPSTRRWSDGTWRRPSASRPTRCWSGPSRTSASGPAAGPATPRWSATGASTTRPPPGTDRDE